MKYLSLHIQCRGKPVAFPKYVVDQCLTCRIVNDQFYVLDNKLNSVWMSKIWIQCVYNAIPSKPQSSFRISVWFPVDVHTKANLIKIHRMQEWRIKTCGCWYQWIYQTSWQFNASRSVPSKFGGKMFTYWKQGHFYLMLAFCFIPKLSICDPFAVYSRSLAFDASTTNHLIAII